jgi:hypothetical protein
MSQPYPFYPILLPKPSIEPRPLPSPYARSPYPHP